MSLHRRLERLAAQVKPEIPPNAEGSGARARMKAALDEIADARREGRAPAPEAVAVGEAIERRRGTQRGEH